MLLQTTSSRGQNIRSGPGLDFAAIGAAYPADVVTLVRFANDAWAEVTLREVTGFMMRSYLREITEVVAPMGHVLVGAHGPGADKHHWLDGVNYRQIKAARLEAVKLLCAGDIDGEIADQLRVDGVKFIMARVYAPITSKQGGAEVMREYREAILRLYAAGVRYFEIGNEPNLFNGANGSQEGMGVAWKNGAEFAAWWFEAVDYLRSKMPEAQFGFPAMSPGWEVPNYRYSPDLFMTEAAYAVWAANWIAMHVYWQDDRVSKALAEVGVFARKYPQKPVIVTEFSNTSAHISKDWKAAQYVEFYSRAKLLPQNIGALFCFVLDNPAFPFESWRGSQIAEMVGARA